MRIAAAVIVAVCIVQAISPAADAPKDQAVPVAQVANAATPGPADKMIEEQYVLTWQKDPRYRGRDPFETVLHEIDAGGAKPAGKIAAPRTPGEEADFAAKALALEKEAEAALGEADYKAVKERLDTLHQMLAIKMVTQTAADKMNEVATLVTDLQGRYAKIRARAALTEALQLATLMQGYFDSARYGDVIMTQDKVLALDNDEGLRNAEVAETGTRVLATCSELKRRAEIHVEFEKKELTIDAVSHFPEGQSFAIVNGEVYGEGVSVAPELVVAGVDNNRVTFNFKGEEISLGLAQ